MGFSIVSPDLELLADRMDNADPIAAYHRAAANIGDTVSGHLAAAYREAGVEDDDFIDTIGNYIDSSGVAYTGIPGGSRHRALAHELEYGTPFIPPSAPVRQTLAAKADDLRPAATSALDEEFGAELMRNPLSVRPSQYREGGDN